jgi:hypothetical protein
MYVNFSKLVKVRLWQKCSSTGAKELKRKWTPSSFVTVRTGSDFRSNPHAEGPSTIYRLDANGFLPVFSAKPVSSKLFLNAWYFSKLVPAHRWQKRSSVGTKELRGNGPFGAFFNETRKR